MTRDRRLFLHPVNLAQRLFYQLHVYAKDDVNLDQFFEPV